MKWFSCRGLVPLNLHRYSLLVQIHCFVYVLHINSDVHQWKSIFIQDDDDKEVIEKVSAHGMGA